MQLDRVTQIGDFSFCRDHLVGHGAFGNVYKGFRNSDKFPIAVKVVELKDVNTDIKVHLLNCQVGGLYKIKHQFVCQTYAILKDHESYFIVMELCPNGTLRDFIKAKHILPEKQALRYFYKLMQGYCEVRNQGYVHRDLKTQNILLRRNLEPVIIDFGFCEREQILDKPLHYNVGSIAYMSPQVYLENKYSEKSDIWALGVILHEMLAGDIPVIRKNDMDQYFYILKSAKTAEIIKNGYCLQTEFLLRNMLAVDLRQRFSCNQILKMLNEHPILASQKKKAHFAQNGELNEIAICNFTNKNMKKMCSTKVLPTQNSNSYKKITQYKIDNENKPMNYPGSHKLLPPQRNVMFSRQI